MAVVCSDKQAPVSRKWQ